MNPGLTSLFDRYEIDRMLAEGCISVVYLAHEQGEPERKLALKVLKDKSISNRIEDLIRFNSEVSITSGLSHPNIVKVIDAGNMNNQNYILMEYLEGHSLDKLLDAGFSVNEIIEIAMQVSRALDYVHGNRIIHRDIKPSNIIVRRDKSLPGELSVKLIDFGLSQIKEYSAISDPDEIVGTFSYMSPEQSGALKRQVDERSDLYSLGVILFQLLAGELPFKSDNISSLIHSHIAVMPVIHKKFSPDMPDVLWKIVLKLLEKEPEKRYQSARGLLNDLKRFRDGFMDFTPGEYDRVIKLSFRSGLVGRDDELNFLKKMYGRTLKGNGGICLIGGEAGMGKTRLAEEIRPQVFPTGGMFIESRCYKSVNRIPYGPFRDALNVYAASYRKRPEWERSEISSRIRGELKDLGQIAIQLNPAMREIIGECPDLVQLEPDREIQRFMMISARLFKIIGEIEGALVFLIDDFQWADEGTYSLLLEMSQTIEKVPVLIFCTFRTEELTENHSMSKFVSRAKESGYHITEMLLKPLNETGMGKLVSGLLYQKEADTVGITELIYRKTNGNPFFAIELLKQMIDEKAIVYNQDRWNFDPSVFRKIEISQKLIDVIIKRISFLSDDEKDLLACASVMGRTIRTDILIGMDRLKRCVNRKDPDGTISFVLNGNVPDHKRVVGMIDNVISLQLMERDMQEKGLLSFSHEKIKEIFYSGLDPQRRRDLHFIAATVLEGLYDGERDEMQFDLAYHFIECNCPSKTLQYAFPAAMKAKGSYANNEAIKYFTVVNDILDGEVASGKATSENLELWIKSHKELGEIYLTIGVLDRAIGLYNSILTRIESKYDKVLIYRQICLAYFKMGDWVQCEKYGRLGLRLLGERLPINSVYLHTRIIKELAVHVLHIVFPGVFRRNPRTAPGRKSTLKVFLYSTMNWMYILSDLKKFINSILRMLNISESRIGESKELGQSLGAFASMCMAIPYFNLAHKFHRLSIDMRRRNGDEWGVGQSLQWSGYCYSWQGNYKESNDEFTRGLEIFRRIGDLWEIGMILGGMFYNDYMSSNYESAFARGREYQVISRKLSDHYGLSRCYQYFSLCFIEMGEFDNAREYCRESLNICKKHSLKFNECVNYIIEGYLCLESRDYEASIRHLEKAMEMDRRNSFLKDYTVHLYNYLAEAHLKKYLADHKGLLRRDSAEIRRIGRLCRLALKKTGKWSNHSGTAMRVSALFNSLLLNSGKAESLFQKSIDHLSRYGRRFETARTLLDYGEFLVRKSDQELGRKKIESAYRIFHEIGAREYIRRSGKLLGMAEFEEEDHYGKKLHDRNRLSTIIKLSQDISSILNIDDLLDHIMSKALEVTGAQRGYLFVKNIESGELDLKVAKNTIMDEKPEYSNTILQTVLKKGETIITTNAEKDDALSMIQSVMRYGLKSILCIPIKYRESVTGICYLDNPLSSGVFTEEEADILGVFMAQAGIAIENAYLYQNLELKVRERTVELNRANEELGIAYNSISEAMGIIKEDLSLARSIQESILPRDLENIPCAEFFIHYYPMSEVGGDIYDVCQIEDGYIRVLIADATGHGVQAALVTMIIMSEYEKVKKSADGPASIIKILNGISVRFYSSIHMMFTCMVLDIDTKNRRILYSCAGHPSQYLIKKDRILHLGRTGRIIGLTEESSYGTEEVAIEPGDRLFLLTDGLYEQFDINGKTFGQDRMFGVIERKMNSSLKEIINEVIDELTSFLNYKKRINENDDITVIGIHLKNFN
ncbi:MAG: SpoIIE family protein phosphatase [Spirochaetes bacterium]|jgi:serine phosphatase RsbU (regulator of sigma subunit)|nr:SpoIIE family protein phosphatase [Spirochaetota bacterium]